MERALPIIGAILVAAGVIVLGLAVWGFLSPAPPPYRYELIAAGGPEDFVDLGLDAAADFAIRKYEVRAEGLREPAAVLYLAEPPSGAPVLLEWRSNATEPILALGPSFAETKTLAEKMAEHLPARALVLAGWDTSRQIGLLTEAEILFDENLGRPLLIPSVWRQNTKDIEATERAFWRVTPTSQAQDAFDQYVAALVLDETAGVAALRALAGGREAYVVVHLFDAYKLGALRPDRFGVGYKDFPGGGQLHGLVGHVKGWLAEHDYGSYAVAPGAGGETTRVFFLTDAAHANTLMARMLPFNTSTPFAIEGLALVYQTGGFWVYHLTASEAEN